ncbi:carbonic anhydrase [Roseivirga pacifica]|uniref:Carbonic anhydrase n=1 Tax=Roseivirga pacifica TaxID=1267423 RepID=A0A1I0QQK9_9BACT|nr:carbonic anhydrase [Roseivirga pacifica]MCO6361039.1 carbonic anhydrase [Roseivirga pacifica]MCO6368928.1 carbonic anhydrase [Roseivirga pacifica]MCO6373071.1 carbonic anhydrase [Roseivirga pacifica]MCO6373151.1 carbonic anhydrase [Roseivirga pacifica]MCO6377592.1 carbonic anhydrase [Roseivirga pacifica]
MTAKEALELLKEGNARYVAGTPEHPNTSVARRNDLTNGQSPFAIVLSCADSRVAPELLFDRGLGELFVIRVAGNVIDDHAIGSIEYAVAHLNTKLIVVLGHESCGAVGASLSGEDPGAHIGSITSKIQPAVAKAKTQEGDLLTNAVKENAKMVGEALAASEPILATAEGLEVVSGYYKLSTGEVDFL